MSAHNESVGTLAMRKQQLASLLAAYQNAHRQRFYTAEEMAAHRAGVRDVAVRLGMYADLTDAIKYLEDLT